MELSILKDVGRIAGLGGLALAVILIVFRNIIAKDIFPMLGILEAYKLLRLLTIAVSIIATIGIISWVYVNQISNTNVISIEKSIEKTKQEVSKDPRKELANKGLLWDDHHFISVYMQNDTDSIIEYLDAGWRMDKTRVLGFFTPDRFNNDVANAIKDKNVDISVICSVPDVEIRPPQTNGSKQVTAWLYMGQLNGIFQDHSTFLYDNVLKSGDENQIALLKRLCAKPDVISKIDKITDRNKYPPQLTNDEKAGFAHWRNIREFLTDQKTPW